MITPSPMAPMAHYYGDIVRKLFLTAGVLILLALPFAVAYVPWPAPVLLLVVLAVTMVAGLTNPKQVWVMWLNVAVAGVGLLAFEWHAIGRVGTPPSWIFVFDQALALIFFFALYYSIKTLRGHVVPDEREQPMVLEKPQSSDEDHPRGVSGLME